jgi:hypothetical protein
MQTFRHCKVISANAMIVIKNPPSDTYPLAHPARILLQPLVTKIKSTARQSDLILAEVRHIVL